MERGNEDEKKWFQLDPAPKKKTTEEYIQLYLSNGKEEELAAFLHYYEPRMNHKVQGYVERFSMEGHFKDLKSVFVYGLYQATKSYDPEYGKPFLQYKEYIVLEEILEYMRTMRTGFTIPSVHEYRTLRNVMKLFNQSDRNYDRKNLEQIANELELSVKTVKEYILAGLDSENVISMEEELDEDSGLTIEDLMADQEASAEEMCFRLLRWERLKVSFEQLTPRQKNVVASRCGICEFCYGNKEEMKFKEIATNNGLASAEAAEQIYKKSVQKLRSLFLNKPEENNWEQLDNMLYKTYSVKEYDGRDSRE